MRQSRRTHPHNTFCISGQWKKKLYWNCKRVEGEQIVSNVKIIFIILFFWHHLLNRVSALTEDGHKLEAGSICYRKLSHNNMMGSQELHGGLYSHCHRLIWHRPSNAKTAENNKTLHWPTDIWWLNSFSTPNARKSVDITKHNIFDKTGRPLSLTKLNKVLNHSNRDHIKCD